MIARGSRSSGGGPVWSATGASRSPIEVGPRAALASAGQPYQNRLSAKPIPAADSSNGGSAGRASTVASDQTSSGVTKNQTRPVSTSTGIRLVITDTGSRRAPMAMPKPASSSAVAGQASSASP